MNIGTIQSCSINDAVYPERLRHIANPPARLFYIGAPLLRDELCVAVVGTRKMSEYGRLVTRRLVEPLCQSGLTIISGLALGIDGLAHETTLGAGGRTIAVVPGGLDEASLYPRQHLNLARNIIKNGGTILSEHPPGATVRKFNFINRNRIIAGLCAGTLIIECPNKSGALITAHYAADENRSVYAVPGSIYAETSQGPNNLIKQGAMPVTEAADIWRDLNLTAPADRRPIERLTPEEEQVLQYISREPTDVDEIIKQGTQNLLLHTGAVTAALVMLEIKGYVITSGNKQQYLRTYE